MPALIVRSGPEAGRRLEVEGEHTIGREDQEFTLADPEISRRHAVVRATSTGLEIEDAGSSNGTFVRGDRIAGATELIDGDEVRMGQTTLSVEAPRTQATRISAASPVDPGATVIRPSAEVPSPGAETPAGAAATPATPQPSEYVAPQPEGTDFQEQTPGQWEGQQQYPPVEQQPPYESPPGQGGQAYGGAAYQGQSEPGAYAPPGQTGWQGQQEQQAYGAPGYPPAGGKKSKLWLWIVIAAVALAVVAAALYFLVFAGSGLDPAKVEAAIQEDISSTGIEVSAVDCPDDIPEETGAEVTCDITVDGAEDAGIDLPTSVTYRQEENGDLSFVTFGE